MAASEAQRSPSLTQIVREWGRIGCVGFGGPPAHIALLRDLCVRRKRWLSVAQFEHAIAATNLLPGPASTQLAIYCAWRLRGRRGALLGGLGFILPGLISILALCTLFLAGSPPSWARGAGMGAGAVVAAVAVQAGLAVARPIWARTVGAMRRRVLVYALVGGIAAATAGPWLVLLLLGSGAAELAWQQRRGAFPSMHAWPLAAASGAGGAGGIGALAWTALKVGALSFGGGFVIIPLMQSDAVSAYHWMTHGQFLNAVALGQITPGPVVLTVAAVGYAAGGIGGGLLAATIAFAPSFGFVLLGATRFERLRGDRRVSAFLAGAAPAAAGAIVGAAVPLALALSQAWQYALLALALIVLLPLRRGVVPTLLLAGAAGATAALLGAPLAQ